MTTSSGTHAQSYSRRSFLGISTLIAARTLVGCSAKTNSSAIPGAGRSLEDIRSSGVLYVGLSSDNSPFAYMNTKGIYDGIDQCFGKYLAYKIGVEVEYVALDPDERYDALLDGRVDVSLVQMSPLDTRADEVVFSGTLYRLPLGIVSPQDTLIASIDQLNEKELIVCAGTYAEQYAQSVWPEIALRTYSTLSDTYNALQNHQGAALLADEMSIIDWIHRTPGYKLGIPAVDTPREIAAALVPGQEELLNKVRDLSVSFFNSSFRLQSYRDEVVSRIGEEYSSMFWDLGY